MDTNKKRSFLKVFAIPAAALVLASVLSPTIGFASATETTDEQGSAEVTEFALPSLPDSDSTVFPNAPGALTPPPPASPANNLMQSLVANKYLTASSSELSLAGPNSVRVTAITRTSNSTLRAGVTSYLQYWNGSAWVNFGAPSTSESTFSASVNYTTTVTKGYYYRVKSDHWVASGSDRESNSSYSGSVLVSK
ncbi:hypothetical protein CDO73_03345 [Saccharibacillus sp. O23]|uniref:hypothetical protein n=1 Tax=Saccharibacillus sp. O23 TaxID=2009338 RepID=UPI000B4E669A|nr:hypothetical protein [Saccharibacillus sp. O23]OWR32648.1 hypothetical protein CDO73_03345 [Saccharibacillus sp. O23]